MSGRALRDIMDGVAHLPTPKPALIARSTAGFWRAKDIYVIRLYQTNILTFYGPEMPMMANGQPGHCPVRAHRIEINPGSWFTPTTKARLCSFLFGYTIGSVDGEWVIYASANYINTVQPFVGPIVIIDGRLPPCPDNPIRHRQIEVNITRFVEFAEWIDFAPPATSGTILLPQDWVTQHLQEKWFRVRRWNNLDPTRVFDNPSYKSGIWDRTFVAAVINTATARVQHKYAAHRLGSPRHVPALRKAVREYLRELTGLQPASPVEEDLREIA